MKLFKLLLKILITVICFIILFLKINVNETIYLLKLISVKTITISVLIFLMHYFAISLRWQFYVKIMNFNISFNETIKLISLGLFSNQIFFGSVAMDAIRIIYLKKKTSFSTALGSVLLDRYTALKSVWIILTIAFFFDNSFVKITYINNIILFICFAGLIFIILPLIQFFPFIKNYKSKKIIQFLYTLSYSFNNSFKNIKNFSNVFLSSFFILFSSGVVTWLIAIDLGANISFLQSLIITLLGLLITALPISINGWGIKEITFISLLGAMNVSTEKSILISLIFGLILLASSVLGMFFYFLIDKNNHFNNKSL